MELKVGQQLFVKYNRNAANRSFTGTITKVGRKWGVLANGVRFNLADMTIDGGQYSSPGHCYLSEEEYKASILLQKAWDDTRSRIRYRPPGHIKDIETINQIRRLLGLGDFNQED